MPRQKLDRKKLLKEPDEFISTTVRLMRWTKRNSRWVAAGCAVLLIVGVATWGWGVYTDRTEMEAQDLLRQAHALYGRSFEATDEGTSRQLLTKAIDRLSEVSNQYPRTIAAWMARIYKGRALLRLDRKEEARAEFELALKGLPKGDEGTLKGLALQGLAEAHMAMGDWPRAEELLKELRLVLGGAFARIADWQLAKCYEALGKKEEALSVYQVLSSVVSDPLEKEMALARVFMLSGASSR